MKILHTADVHLKADKNRTIRALENVLERAAEEGAALVTIGGDLFDSSGDAEELRPKLRELFKDNPFDVIAIPGNHDQEVYKKNLRFGEDLEVLVDKPVTVRDIGDVEVIGVPFTSSLTEELYRELQEAGDPAKTQIALIHCTLDIGFLSDDVGVDEGTYFPVTQATLSEFEFDYILAGHIHSTDREVPLDSGGKFIYPGSPVSHSTSETGKRNAVRIETDEDRITSLELDTFYYDEYSKTVIPGGEPELFEEIQRWVSSRAADDCELTVFVDGYVDRDEDEFYEELKEAADPVDPIDETRTVSDVLTHPLYQRFNGILEDMDDVDDEERVRTQVMDVLSQLLVQNKVQTT